MTDLEIGILLAFAVAQTFLLILFLAGFRALSKLISPLIEQFTTQSGKLKLPAIKEAMGYGLMKLIDSVDMSKILGGVGKSK